MNDIYEKLANPPQDALSKIPAGNLKGKSDINPQWRYEAVTDVFGLCGDGWKFEVTNTTTIPVEETGELMIFVSINFYYNMGEKWSAPIPGHGGDYLIVKDKNGIHGNDEAMKMAVTDALGAAMKMVGVAADVYRGKFNTKYSRSIEIGNQNKRQQASSKKPETVNDYYALVIEYARQNKAVPYIVPTLKRRFGKSKFLELSLVEAKAFYENIGKLISEEKQLESDDDEKLMQGIG